MGSQINTYGPLNESFPALAATIDAALYGRYLGTLTQLNSELRPSIAKGTQIYSSLDGSAGSYYHFRNEEEISIIDPDTASEVLDGAVYIRLIENGDTATAAFTNTEPEWNNLGMMWMEPGGSTVYFPWQIWKTGELWTPKTRLHEGPGARAPRRVHTDYNGITTTTAGAEVLVPLTLSLTVKPEEIWEVWSIAQISTFPAVNNAIIGVGLVNSTTGSAVSMQGNNSRYPSGVSNFSPFKGIYNAELSREAAGLTVGASKYIALRGVVFGPSAGSPDENITIQNFAKNIYTITNHSITFWNHSIYAKKLVH